MNAATMIETVEMKPAPEPLLAIQALLDTRVILRGEERFRDPASTRDWLVAAGLLESRAGVSDSEFGELIAFREALRVAIRERDGDGGPDAATELDAIAERHPVRVRIGSDGPVLPTGPAADVAEVISRLLGIALDSASRDEWRRLKICAAPDCRWAFYDRAKNRSGAWCSMETCGNRAKARAHRARAHR